MFQAKGERLRVLLLSSEYPPNIIGGLGTHIGELAPSLGRAGCQVTVCALTTHKSSVVREANLTTYLIPRTVAKQTTANQAPIHPGLMEVVNFNNDLVKFGQSLFTGNGHRPELIHCHDWLTYPAANELGRTFGVPVIGTVHILNYPICKYWGSEVFAEILEIEKELCCDADGLITVSESMKRLIGQTHGVSADRITVIHNGLDWRVFAQPELSPAQLQSLRQKVAPGGERVILFAGRLTAQKGITALLESAAQVLTAEEQVRYLVVGEADSLASAQVVETLRRQHQPLGARLQLLGRLARKQLSLLYQVADVAVVSSLYEPFGYAAVEAMAAGVAVVATAVGGLPEIIEHERSGLLVPVQPTATGAQQVDVAALAQAQLRLLRDEALRQRLAQAGQQRVIERFNVETMVDRTVCIYRRIAASVGH